jgi:hypothetical protein
MVVLDKSATLFALAGKSTLNRKRVLSCAS